MRTIYCDAKDCLSSEIIDEQLHQHYGRPEGWKELRVSGSSVNVRREYCPDCVAKMNIFKAGEPQVKLRASLEEILREIVQEVIEGNQEG